jgi:hypothetical protein
MENQACCLGETSAAAWALDILIDGMDLGCHQILSYYATEMTPISPQ